MAYGETNLTFVATLTTLLFCSLYIHSQTQQVTAPVAYDYDQRSDWRPAPRPVTQPRPYQRPAPRVAYPKPTTRPTAAPKKAQKPVASCLDDPTWYYGMDKTKNCAHVGCISFNNRPPTQSPLSFIQGGAVHGEAISSKPSAEACWANLIMGNKNS